MLSVCDATQVERLADAAFLTDAEGTVAVWNMAAMALLPARSNSPTVDAVTHVGVVNRPR